MEYKVITIKNFEKEARKLIKKYRSLSFEINQIIDELAQNPFQGDLIGENIYKIRLAIKSKGKGKSGGARIVTTIKIKENEVIMLSIYDKSEQENITDSEIRALLKEI